MNHTRTHAHPWGPYALICLLAMLLIFILLYVVLVFKTVAYTASKQHVYTTTTQTNSVISELESKYISLKNGITSETAIALGFKEVTAKSYVSKPSLGLSRRGIE